MAKSNFQNEDIRLQAIPVIHVRGNFYEVGFAVGKTFKSNIQDFVSASYLLNECYIPLYNTPEGLAVYNETLEVVTESFPQYVRELHGVADGADVEFYKVTRRE
jgi:hypothetical protein